MLERGLHAGLDLPPPRSQVRPPHGCCLWQHNRASRQRLAAEPLGKQKRCVAPFLDSHNLMLFTRRGSHLGARLVEVAVPVYTGPHTHCQLGKGLEDRSLQQGAPQLEQGKSSSCTYKRPSVWELKGHPGAHWGLALGFLTSGVSLPVLSANMIRGM